MKVRSSSAVWGALLSGRKALARFNNAVFVQVVFGPVCMARGARLRQWYGYDTL